MLSPAAPPPSFEMSVKYDDTDENETLLPASPPPPVHDGVRARAWSTLFGAWLAIAATFGYIFAFGVYEDVYTRADVASATGIRWIGAAQLSLLLGTSFPAGLLHDAGHFRSVTSFGSCLFTLSLFVLSTIDLGDSYFKFLLTQGIVMGVAAGFVFVPSLAIQAEHWDTRSTLAIGIASTGLFAGGTFFTIMLNQLLHHGVSFAWSVRASALAVLGMLLVANACMRPAYPRAEPGPKGDKRVSMKKLVTDAPYMYGSLGGLFLNGGVYFVYFYFQRYVIDKGMDRTFALYTPAILCGAAVPGGILSNLVATQCRTSHSVAVTMVFMFAFLLPFFPKTSTGIVLCAVVYGALAGAWFSLFPSTINTMSKSTRDCGVRLGLAFALGALAVLAGTPYNDWLLGARPTSQDDWSLAIILNNVRTIFRSPLPRRTSHAAWLTAV
ncbi:MFS general substrate transporter [Auriscalpium vulgare]|uniref:MFS general substrate transporter n=1 Tax=Auriscalpium vulgare TaxID=40419 RepID=A0ACB8RI66_9AGAM|nr:MFS general substrate transporter [Auriscalpium vulgare]